VPQVVKVQQAQLDQTVQMDSKDQLVQLVV
jgi:hypothetical protein